MVAFVSNGGYIDANNADGLRKTLSREFHDIYVYNLRGNQRTAGEESRREGGKIFDSGSRNTVAILLLVKRPGPALECRLRYHDIGDYLDRKEKLRIVDHATLADLKWESLTPNSDRDWINQRNDLFESFMPLSAKDGPNGSLTSFQGPGLVTGRDAWAYSFSRKVLKEKARSLTLAYAESLSSGRPIEAPNRINWSRGLRAALARKQVRESAGESVRMVSYRPFNKQLAFGDDDFIESVGRTPGWFDISDGNWGICLTGAGSHFDFCCIAANSTIDLHLLDSGQFFPRYTYVAPTAATLFASEGTEPQLVDNITDAALADYTAAYGPEVTKDDIFHYVYGLLHSPEYRTRFAADLKKMLPRIPDWSREHEQPRYIIDLIGRLVALSLETNRIVDSLPDLGL